MEAGPTDVATTLNYNVEDGERQYYVAYAPTDEERVASNIPTGTFKGGQSVVKTIVHDGRGKKLTLDANSFELVQQTTSLSTDDFYSSPEKVTSVYYDEMAETIKNETGAAHVKVFHHQVRSAAKSNADGHGFDTSVQPYAHAVHSDSCAHSAEQFFLHLAKTLDKKYCKGRFLHVNAWRNIADAPIEDDALAVCDESSLVKPDDYIASDLYAPGYKTVQYRLSDRNASQHRWFYFSKMKKDEVLLFKQWDSDRTLAGRISFHTAFKDPGARPGAPDRQSIEVRAFAFFPDHEPNTCPALPSVVKQDLDLSDDEEVNAAVKKMLGLIDTMPSWPSFAKTWLKSTAVNSAGAKQVAEQIVKDDGNHQGFREYGDATKAQIVSLLLETDWEARLLAQVARMKASGSGKKASDPGKAAAGAGLLVADSSALSSMAWFALGCIAGYIVGASSDVVFKWF